jgi:hypothetical protein
VSQGNYVAPIESQLSKIETAFKAKYPLKTFTFVDRSIGGTKLSDVSTVLSSGWPSWYTNHTLTWMSYIVNAGCTTIITSFGLNDTGFESGSTWITYFNGIVAGYPNSSVDEIISTNIVANPAGGAPYNTQPYQSGYLANAALQRNIAANPAILAVTGLSQIGLIDIGRLFNMAVFGRDPVEQVLTYSVLPSTPLVIGTTTTASFSYNLPNTDGDFDVILQLNNGSALTPSAAIQINLCANASGSGGSQGISCFIQFLPNGGTNFYAQAYFTGATFINTNVGGWTSTNNTMEVSVQAGHVQVYCNGVIAIDQILPIPEGNAFTPNILITNPANNTTVTLNQYAYGTMRQYTPSLNQAAVYGSSPNGVNSGNGINHVSSYGLNGVYAPAIEAALPPGASSSTSAGSATPTTGTTVTIPSNQAFTAITPAGSLAALTVSLPLQFPQAKTVQFTVSQAITSLTVSAPTGTTISGNAITGASSAAGTPYSYVRQGTVYYRVQ